MCGRQWGRTGLQGTGGRPTSLKAGLVPEPEADSSPTADGSHWGIPDGVRPGGAWGQRLYVT